MLQKAIDRRFKAAIYLCSVALYSPVERCRASHLRERIYINSSTLAITRVLNEKLFTLYEIGRITHLINASRVIPRPSHVPSSARDVHHVEIIRDPRMTNETLNKRYEPSKGNLLRSKLLIEVIVPHISLI